MLSFREWLLESEKQLDEAKYDYGIMQQWASRNGLERKANVDGKYHDLNYVKISGRKPTIQDFEGLFRYNRSLFGSNFKTAKKYFKELYGANAEPLIKSGVKDYAKIVSTSKRCGEYNIENCNINYNKGILTIDINNVEKAYGDSYEKDYNYDLKITTASDEIIYEIKNGNSSSISQNVLEFLGLNARKGWNGAFYFDLYIDRNAVVVVVDEIKINVHTYYD